MQAPTDKQAAETARGIAGPLRLAVPRFMRRSRAEAQMGDQVVRLEQWKARHPDVEIQNPDYRNGDQFWFARRDGEVLCREYELRVLLDHLDWLTAQDQPADA
jgi:hypothetical protein